MILWRDGNAAVGVFKRTVLYNQKDIDNGLGELLMKSGCPGVKKYVISEIYADGYERTAIVKEVDGDAKYIVHFLEYDEYLEKDGEALKRKTGDILEGTVSIDLVNISKRVNKDLMHRQVIKKSSHIEAIVEVSQVIDDCSVYAFSSVSKNNVLIKFEDSVDYMEGDRIFIEGSLEINKIEY